MKLIKLTLFCAMCLAAVSVYASNDTKAEEKGFVAYSACEGGAPHENKLADDSEKNPA